MNFLVRIVVNALALAAAAWLIDGITVGGTKTVDQIVTLLVVALIFGLVNAIVAPVVKLLSLPFIVLTLGLLLVVINALMLMLTGWITRMLQPFGAEYLVEGFWAAFLGAIVIGLVNWVLGMLLPTRARG